MRISRNTNPPGQLDYQNLRPPAHLRRSPTRLRARELQQLQPSVLNNGNLVNALPSQILDTSRGLEPLIKSTHNKNRKRKQLYHQSIAFSTVGINKKITNKRAETRQYSIGYNKLPDTVSIGYRTYAFCSPAFRARSCLIAAAYSRVDSAVSS